MLAKPGETMTGEAAFYSEEGRHATPGAADVLTRSPDRLCQAGVVLRQPRMQSVSMITLPAASSRMKALNTGTTA
jgi:hypothetical protein